MNIDFLITTAIVIVVMLYFMLRVVYRQENMNRLWAIIAVCIIANFIIFSWVISCSVLPSNNPSDIETLSNGLWATDIEISSNNPSDIEILSNELRTDIETSSNNPSDSSNNPSDPPNNLSVSKKTSTLASKKILNTTILSNEYEATYKLFSNQFSTLLTVIMVFGLVIPIALYTFQRQSLKEERERIEKEFEKNIKALKKEFEEAKEKINGFIEKFSKDDEEKSQVIEEKINGFEKKLKEREKKSEELYQSLASIFMELFISTFNYKLRNNKEDIYFIQNYIIFAGNSIAYAARVEESGLTKGIISLRSRIRLFMDDVNKKYISQENFKELKFIFEFSIKEQDLIAKALGDENKELYEEFRSFCINIGMWKV